MFAVFFQSLIPIIIQIIGFLLEKYITDQSAKKAFTEFVAKLEMGGLKSVNLNKSYRDQIAAYKLKHQKDAPKIQ